MIVSLKKPEKRGVVQRDTSMTVSLRSPRAQQPESVRSAHVMPSALPPGAESDMRATRPPVATRRKRRRVPGFVILLVLALLLAIAAGVYFSFAPASLSATNAASTAASQSEQASVEALVSRVGALMVLPQGETPTIATVTDLSALSGQTFFANAALGDKVLMYPKAGQAILYDPVADKIIQVGPLTVSGQ